MFFELLDDFQIESFCYIQAMLYINIERYLMKFSNLAFIRYMLTT